MGDVPDDLQWLDDVPRAGLRLYVRTARRPPFLVIAPCPRFSDTNPEDVIPTDLIEELDHYGLLEPEEHSDDPGPLSRLTLSFPCVDLEESGDPAVVEKLVSLCCKNFCHELSLTLFAHELDPEALAQAERILCSLEAGLKRETDGVSTVSIILEGQPPNNGNEYLTEFVSRFGATLLLDIPSDECSFPRAEGKLAEAVADLANHGYLFALRFVLDGEELSDEELGERFDGWVATSRGGSMLLTPPDRDCEIEQYCRRLLFLYRRGTLPGNRLFPINIISSSITGYVPGFIFSRSPLHTNKTDRSASLISRRDLIERRRRLKSFIRGGNRREYGNHFRWRHGLLHWLNHGCLDSNLSEHQLNNILSINEICYPALLDTAALCLNEKAEYIKARESTPNHIKRAYLVDDELRIREEILDNRSARNP